MLGLPVNLFDPLTPLCATETEYTPGASTNVVEPFAPTDCV
jgi:hypothetical protein